MIGTPWAGDPMPELDPAAASLDQIELIEKVSIRVVVQAVLDFAGEACREFHESPDDQQDIAEDLTREAVDALGGYAIRKRLYGNIDYKRARWVALPSGLMPQALLVDSKAEKAGSSVTLQTSQVSMPIEFRKRDGAVVREAGALPATVPLSTVPDRQAITTVIVVGYEYRDAGEGGCRYRRCLDRIHVVAVPHASLMRRYCPDLDDTIWLVGRNSPARGEAFRVRLSYSRLEAKARWRHQVVSLNDECEPYCEWSDVGIRTTLRPSTAAAVVPRVGDPE